MVQFAAPLTRPNLFIVGAPRCGTSAMFRLLAQHPDVSVSNPKEPYYFCSDFHEESDRHSGAGARFPVRSEDAYLALFADRSRRVVAEATPAYLYSRVAASRIHAFNPDARILVMVRDPIALLHSLHAKMMSYGLENLRDFRQALEAESARRMGRQIPAGVFWPSSLHYSEWVRLGEQIERYRRVFPADRVRTIVYDDFRRDNFAVYADVVAFLGLRAAFPVAPRHANENRSPRFPLLARAIARAGDLRIKNLVPYRVRRRIRNTLRTANAKPIARSPLDPELLRELRVRFRPAVDDLGRVLQRDLVSLWGYDRPVA